MQAQKHNHWSPTHRRANTTTLTVPTHVYGPHERTTAAIKPRRRPTCLAVRSLRIGIGGSPSGSGRTGALGRPRSAGAARTNVRPRPCGRTNDIYTTRRGTSMRHAGVCIRKPDRKSSGAPPSAARPTRDPRNDIAATLDAVRTGGAPFLGRLTPWCGLREAAATTSPRRSRSGWPTCRSSCSTCPGGGQGAAQGRFPASPSSDLLVETTRPTSAARVGASLP